MGFIPKYSLAFAFLLSESQPYQDLEQGAVGGDLESPAIGALRLDDDNEFPPMTHKND